MPKSSSKSAKKNDGEVSFEQALAELEGIVRQLEEGNLGLSESLAQYEQGVRRLKECYELLQRAERRIELLERVDAQGEPVTRPFEDEATIEQHTGSPSPEDPAAGKGTTKAKPANQPTKPTMKAPPPDGTRELFD